MTSRLTDLQVDSRKVQEQRVYYQLSVSTKRRTTTAHCRLRKFANCIQSQREHTISSHQAAADETETLTMPDSQPVSVLFVCLGNICRSPMAEGVFRSLASSNPLISKIDSCGTGAYHAGDSPDPRTMAVLKANGIKDYKHRARKVRVPEDFEDFDYVLAMDGMNLSDLRAMVKRKGLGEEAMERVKLFGEFGGKSKKEEVGDPYYGGNDGFEIAFEQLQRFGRGLLEVVEREAGQGK